VEQEQIEVKIYNTPEKKLVKFEPYDPELVTMYSCGPTVYNEVHVGNLRSLVNFDVVGRSLRYLGYNVKRAVNFTDVGHMTTNSDFGEDKLEKQARIEKTTSLQIANKYIKSVIKNFAKLNILNPNGSRINPEIDVENTTKEQWAKLGWARAIHYIPEMIELIKMIEKNGHTYETNQALYFDITTFPDYGKFTGQKIEEKQVAVRSEVKVDKEKRNPADFVLWMKRTGKYKDHMMHWDSPWGDGFPGWHIECSTMSWKLLGEEIDIHTGGSDLMSIHHPNEIAQNYGALGKKIVKYWLHNEFVSNAQGDKLSKTKKNAFTLKEIEDLGFSYMALRWYYLTATFRTPLKFSIEALESAEIAYNNVVSKLARIDIRDIGEPSEEYIKEFKDALCMNFNTPVALAILQDMVNSDIHPGDKLATAFEFDKVLGLDLEKAIKNYQTEKMVIHIDNVKDKTLKILLERRKKARDEKDWRLSDEIRDEIEMMGYQVIDKKDGQYLKQLDLKTD
jgi:cysteinyl-tRNA synthetase